jgi:hypothetical protein
MDSIYAFFLWKINPKLENPHYNYKETPSLYSKAFCSPPNFHTDPWISNIFPD